MYTRINGQSLTDADTVALAILGTLYSERVQELVDRQIAGVHQGPVNVEFYRDEHVAAASDAIQEFATMQRHEAYADGRKQGQADMNASVQLSQDLTRVLGRYAGERYTSEGAVEVLNRIINERNEAQSKLKAITDVAADSRATGSAGAGGSAITNVANVGTRTDVVGSRAGQWDAAPRVQCTDGLGGVSYSKN